MLFTTILQEVFFPLFWLFGPHYFVYTGDNNLRYPKNSYFRICLSKFSLANAEINTMANVIGRQYRLNLHFEPWIRTMRVVFQKFKLEKDRDIKVQA